VLPDSMNMDPAGVARLASGKTATVIPVHLFGNPADLPAIRGALGGRTAFLLEDAAQAVGAVVDGRPVGAWGDVTCLSFYPTKNLGACGDGGMILTDRDDLAERARRLRHHGDVGRYQHVELGFCSRLDELQAAILRVKLQHLEEWTLARRRIAERYRTLLAGTPLTLPVERVGARHVYSLYTVRHPQRDAFAKALADLGVGTAIHYPIPVPAQPLFGARDERAWPEAWRAAREVVSLPCFAELTDAEVEEVAQAVRLACGRL